MVPTKESQLTFYYTNQDGVPVFEHFVENKQYLFIDNSKGISSNPSTLSKLREDNTIVRFNSSFKENQK